MRKIFEVLGAAALFALTAEAVSFALWLRKWKMVREDPEDEETAKKIADAVEKALADVFPDGEAKVSKVIKF